MSALTDGKAHLIGIEEHIGAFLLFVDHDVVHACRVERTLDVEHRVGREGDDVDVFVFEFAHDTADAVTAHAHARTHRVDVGVVAFHRDFGAFARDACHIVEHNHAFCDFRNFATKELAQIHWASAREVDFGITIIVVHAVDDRLHTVALAEEVAGYLLAFGQEEVVLCVVNEKRFVFPSLINFSRNDFTHAVDILII